MREYKNINEEYKKNVKKGITVYIVIFNVELSEKYRLEGTPQWYKHDTEGVTETEEYKILCDFVIQCDIKIEAWGPDVVAIDKTKKEINTIDVTIPVDV